MKNFDTGTTIAVCALISVLFILIQISVWPIRKDIDRLEAGQAEIKQLLIDNQA